MPETAPIISFLLLRYGTGKVLHIVTVYDAFAKACVKFKNNRAVFLHHFDDDSVYMEQRTIRIEILEDMADI